MKNKNPNSLACMHVDLRAVGIVIMLLLAGTFAGCERDSLTEIVPLTTPAGVGSAEPHLSRTSDGSVVLGWVEPAGESVALRHAVRVDKDWGPPRTIASGSNWFVNWADFPSVSPIRDDLWAAHWLVKRFGGTYAYDVAVALSHDAGKNWSAPIIPHSDGTPTEHGFVTLFPWQDTVGVLWLDGRQMTEDPSAEHGGAGGMTLRSAQLNGTGTIEASHLVDDFVCDCCQTDVAIARDGPVAVYRNRTAQEIRDVYVARAVSGEWQLGAPVADDGWEISGCPVNGPAIVATDQQVAVAWFTAANDQPRVRAAYSTDGGATFAQAIDVDIERPVGRVDIEMLDAQTLVVSWVAGGTEGRGEILARAIGLDGSVGPTRAIVQTATARRSGFPQMIRQGKELVFAWTDASGEQSQVRTATLPISAFR